jgi:hypothetical protein
MKRIKLQTVYFKRDINKEVSLSMKEKKVKDSISLWRVEPRQSKDQLITIKLSLSIKRMIILEN